MDAAAQAAGHERQNGCRTSTQDSFHALYLTDSLSWMRQLSEAGAVLATLTEVKKTRGDIMNPIRRRTVLIGAAGLVAPSLLARAQGVKPRLTAISQWSGGSDGAAITALGKKFEERGGVWQYFSDPGFTTEMMNKLRAQII